MLLTVHEQATSTVVPFVTTAMLRSLTALRSSSLLGSIQFVPQILGVNWNAQLQHGTPDVALLHQQQQQVHTRSAPHPSPEADAGDVKQQLLGHALAHVKRLGWTRSSIAAAAADMQLSPASVGMFPRGPSELVEHFMQQQNAALEKELQAAGQQFRDLPLRKRISSAVRRRLEMNAAHMDSWPQVCAVGCAVDRVILTHNMILPTYQFAYTRLQQQSVNHLIKQLTLPSLVVVSAGACCCVSARQRPSSPQAADSTA
jgi:rpsU-divergently transcribed protein